MISKTIRAWNIQQNRFPSVFLYQNTTTGIFSISEVEAEITEGLLPLEQLSLELVEQLEAITRIEVHAFSGISVEICSETLDKLQYHGLLRIRDYSPELLKENIEKIKDELGDDWYTPYVIELSNRKLLKQYELTKEGKKAVSELTKTVQQTTDLNIVVTGTPFYLFYDNFDIKTDGYEHITMEPNLVKHLLGHAEKYWEETGIKPLAIGPNTVTEGKEVSNSQFWITIEAEPEDNLDDAKFNMYLSSTSFERWASPKWNEKLRHFVDDLEVEFVEDIVMKAMSETWMMVEEVVEEGLSLSEDKVTWRLQADLEMQKLIYNVMPDPIRYTQAEIKLRLPNVSWKVVILLQLEPWDDLSLKSLRAGRFHQVAPRKGFTLEEGYFDYTEMMQDWGKEIDRKDYLETLEDLVKYNCLIERMPEIKSIVVDVDDVLRENRRGRQDWQFSRLRELESLFEQNSIKHIRYLATNQVKKKIDEPEELDRWINDGKLEIIDGFEQEIPETIEAARKAKAHYIGNKKMKSKKKSQDYSRTLKFSISRKRLHIPGLEPFYDWQLENIFQQMFDVYYE